MRKMALWKSRRQNWPRSGRVHHALLGMSVLDLGRVGEWDGLES